MKIHTLLVMVFVCAVLPHPARADWTARVVARSSSDEPFRGQAVQARVGEPVELGVVLVGEEGRVYADLDSVALRRRAHAPAEGLPEGTTVRWWRVVPRLLHQELPPPNPGNSAFSNNVLFGPRHGEWIGYDQLEYDTVPLMPSSQVRMDGERLFITGAQATVPRQRDEEAGSSWFAAELVLADGTVVRSPDGDDLDRYGLSTNVMRVSFRAGDDYLGWLGTYFNVPNLFGSSGSSDERHQSERYVGVDCADVLIGALRASGRRDAEYTSVAGIRRFARPVTEEFLVDDTGVVRMLDGQALILAWGEDIQPGDLIAINYEAASAQRALPRSWDHIGALLGDSPWLGGSQPPAESQVTASGDGILDGRDGLRHISMFGLTDAPLSSQGAIRVRIWRWDQS